MANIFLDEETKDRLTKALFKMQATENTALTFSGAVSRLLDQYEKAEVTA